MTLQVGMEIGPYQITDQIGAGGMATIYKAYQPKLDRHVAIKVMHESFAHDQDFRSRFQREARIVARLDHPNIVPVYDYDEVEGRPYLVMKHIEGQTLKRLLEKDALTEEDKLKVLTAVAQALTYAHEQGILHRDVKPSNIVIDQRGVPYLTDFGLARIAQTGESTLSIDTMLGTPHYISPEQAQADASLDARTDVYSLGVVLYEMAAGRVPFRAESSYAVIHDHIYTPPPSPRQLNPDVSPELEQVILRALAKNPADRYDTPVALIDAYKHALHAKAPENEGRLSESAVSWVAALTEEEQNERKPHPEPSFEQNMEEFGERMARWGERMAEKHGDNHHDDDKEDEDKEPDFDSEKYAHLTVEERIRLKAEYRVRKRQEKLRELLMQTAFFLFLNFAIFNTDAWINSMIESSRFISPPIHLWFLFIFWGIGLISQYADYYSKYGPGRRREERLVQREIERERARLYGEKRKHDDLPDRGVRLTPDGELSESFIEEWDEQARRKRS